MVEQANHAQVVLGQLASRCSGHAARPGPELDVLQHRVPGEQRVLLEHHAAVRAGAADGLAVDENRTTGRADEAGGHVEQRRLATAARPEQALEAVLRHFEREILHGNRGPRAASGDVDLGNVLEREFRLSHRAKPVSNRAP